MGSQLGSKTSSKSTKSRSRGKYAGSGTRIDKEIYALQFPGAILNKAHIRCRDAIRNQWRDATVIHCRARPEIARPSEPSHYDYYVHFDRLDRRLDCWVLFDDVRELGQKLPEGAELEPLPDSESDDEHGKMDSEYLREHEENTKLKTINRVEVGPHTVDAWYFSPFPREYQGREQLFICELCLAFFKSKLELECHKENCTIVHPPGNEIYRDRDLSMWELDGTFSKVYCENLCFLAKLFLDHKTLKHPVSLFLFYVLTEVTSIGFVPVGYFSKEKYSRNNLSCICTLPQHQRKGYGKLLINFSYALSQQEGKRGTPERPLSDLGRASYLSFWTVKIVEALTEQRCTSINEIADATSIEPADIVRALRHSKMLHWRDGAPFIVLPSDQAKNVVERLRHAPWRIRTELIHWEPYDAYLAPVEFCPNS